MKRLFLFLLLVASSHQPRAGVFIFDDDTSTWPSYQGLVFSGMNTLNPFASPFFFYPNGYSNGIVSLPKVLIGSPDFNPFFYSPDPATDFNLESAYVGAGWNDGLQVTFSGFDDNVLKHQRTVTVDTQDSTLVSFDWLSIDRVAITAAGGVPNPEMIPGGEYFYIDNMNITVIPEPTGYAVIIGLTLLGLGLSRQLWRSQTASRARASSAPG